MQHNIKCPVCKCQDTESFLLRKNFPVHQNFIFRDKASAVNSARGDIDLLLCNTCGFIFNKSFDESKLHFGAVYDNTQSKSAIFSEYMNRAADYLISRWGVHHKRIVEVGCGKGDFLKLLVEKSDSIGFGFDPSYEGPSTTQNGKVKFFKTYYDEKASSTAADVVVCRHVIEHIQDPLSLLENIKQALSSSAKSILFFETPSVKWILENKVFYDFFYEHCSYFDVVSLKSAFSLSGFHVLEVKYEFQEQYMWLIASFDGSQTADSENSKSHEVMKIEKLAEAYKQEEKAILELWENKIVELRNLGNIAIWGAGAKGVTFANLIDPLGEQIKCVIDINSNKHGGHLPGTGHPIISTEQIADNHVQAIIIMNPNYREEIVNILAEKNLSISLLNWEDVKI